MIEQDYTKISPAYDNFMTRGVQPTVGAGVVGTGTQIENPDAPIRDGDSVGDLWIQNFIRSKGWKPKSAGFYIDGQTGYAEFMEGYIGGNFTVGGKFILGGLSITIDNTQNIQTTIDTVDAAGGGTVYLKAGTFTPTSDIVAPSSVSLVGTGIGSTIIDFGGGAFQVLFQGTARTVGGTGVTITEGSTTVTGNGGTTFLTDIATNDVIITSAGQGSGAVGEVSSVTNDTTLVLKNAWPYPTMTKTPSIFKPNSNCQIRNLTITNSSKSVLTGVLVVQRAINFLAENVFVTKNTATGGIYLNIVLNSELRNIESSYNGDGGTTDSGFQLDQIKRVSLYNCSSIGNLGSGFDLNSAGISEGNAFYSCFAEGNTQDGFQITGSTNLFSCRSMGNDGDGFDIIGDYSVLSGCIAKENAANGIQLTNGADNNVLQNCLLSNNDLYGINIASGVTKTTISNPIFVSNTSGTIQDAGTNTHYDNQSSGTFTAANGANNNIDVAENRFVRIAGPTAAFSISGIAAPVNGKTVTLYNSAAFDMTITNDATSTAVNRILTLTGADVVLTGVSSATFIYNLTDARWILVGTSG